MQNKNIKNDIVPQKSQKSNWQNCFEQSRAVRLYKKRRALELGLISPQSNKQTGADDFV